jgi:hypothetical protein
VKYAVGWRRYCRRAIHRVRIDRQMRELALEHAGGLLGDNTT